MIKTITLVSIAVLITGCLKEEHPFLPYTGIEPKSINDGWEISTPSAENMDEEGLSKIYQVIQANGELWQLRSILVFRNNKLIAENYLKDEKDIHNPRPIWSCTKQIVGILTGIAIENGILNSINDPISLYLNSELQDHPDKKDITISNLLTMRGGIGFDESRDVSALFQYSPDNVIDFILSKSMMFPPGQTFNYNSGETHLISASIQNAVNQTLKNWSDEVLFSKIGFSNYTWLAYDGYNFGGYGISTTPRDLAKIAHLILNKGNWGDEQIVDSLWIEQMVSTQTQINGMSEYTFGNLWWINESKGVYFMAGSGGQYACIVPDKDLIIVAMSEHDTDLDLEIDIETFMRIVEDIRNVAF